MRSERETRAELASLRNCAYNPRNRQPTNPGAPMYEAVTRGIRIRVTPQYLEEESAPDEGRYLWAYTIEISNEGSETVQLRSRHWRITDGDGRTEEVRGPGVVGQTPAIQPGTSFRYTSGCPLRRRRASWSAATR